MAQSKFGQAAAAIDDGIFAARTHIREVLAAGLPSLLAGWAGTWAVVSGMRWFEEPLQFLLIYLAAPFIFFFAHWLALPLAVLGVQTGPEVQHSPGDAYRAVLRRPGMLLSIGWSLFWRWLMTIPSLGLSAFYQLPVLFFLPYVHAFEPSVHARRQRCENLSHLTGGAAIRVVGMVLVLVLSCAVLFFLPRVLLVSDVFATETSRRLEEILPIFEVGASCFLPGIHCAGTVFCGAFLYRRTRAVREGSEMQGRIDDLERKYLKDGQSDD